MPPVSSLIFVVILAVWAVYLVQHWVRRRDHLATARSVDRFSESMRVLERRRALPRPDIVEHAPPSTSVLLRPASPEVVVKRGATAVPAAARQAAGRSRPVAAQPVATRPGSTGSRSRAVATAVGPTPGYRRARLMARLRAAGLAAGSVLMITLVVLTVTQALHWGWSFAGLAVLAGTVAAIRWSVSRSAAARRRGTTTSRPTARRQPAQRPAARPARAADVVQPSEAASRSPLAAQARATVGVPSTPARRAVDLDRRPAPALYDIDQVETELAPATVTAAAATTPAPAAEEPSPGSWSPVPVPPPTYTLKARAHRGVQPATGSLQLPLDGTEMALDEEFEDLPSVDRVG